MNYRLLVNLTILNQHRLTGLGIYCVNLVSRLLERTAENSVFSEVVLIGSAARLRELFPEGARSDRVRLLDEPVTNPIWRPVRLRRLVRKECQGRPDTVFYSPTHHGVPLSGVKQIITVHDLFARLYPANYRMQYLYFKHYLPRVLRHTDMVICDSDSTATDLARFYSRLPQSVTVHCALREDIGEVTPEPVPELFEDDFFLFVGPNYWYKNSERVIGAFAEFCLQRPGHKLVFAGGTDSYLQSLRQLIAKDYAQFQDRIVFPGYVSSGQLTWLYTRADALVITTLYEGFGLPALEAMNFGCPVIGSDRGALPEVCGDAALLVDPERQEQITEAMLKIIDDDHLRSKLIERGYENLARFDWKRSANRVYELITELAARAM